MITLLKKLGLLTLFLSGGSLLAQAADVAAKNKPESISQEDFMWFLLTLTVILMIVVLVLVIAALMAVDLFFKNKYGKSFLPNFNLKIASNGWKRFTGQRTKQQASGTQEKVLDHDYDGIVELDNNAPPLFNYILYGTVIYAVIYLLIFHVFESAPLQAEEYAEEMRIAKIEEEKRLANAADNVTAETVTLLTDGASISSGQSIFKGNCVSCHGDKAQGNTGPNLTDKYWIHGGSIKDVFTTITKGVQGKMPAHEKILKAKQRAEVASYILSLDYVEGKEQEGELYEPKEEEKATDEQEEGEQKEEDKEPEKEMASNP